MTKNDSLTGKTGDVRVVSLPGMWNLRGSNLGLGGRLSDYANASRVQVENHSFSSFCIAFFSIAQYSTHYLEVLALAFRFIVHIVFLLSKLLEEEKRLFQSFRVWQLVSRLNKKQDACV